MCTLALKEMLGQNMRFFLHQRRQNDAVPTHNSLVLSLHNGSSHSLVSLLLTVSYSSRCTFLERAQQNAVCILRTLKTYSLPETNNSTLNTSNSRKFIILNSLSFILDFLIMVSKLKCFHFFFIFPNFSFFLW